MEIERIEYLDGKSFSEFMSKLKDAHPEIWQKYIDGYFSNGDYIIGDPILESWNNDPDDVWDCEASIVRECTTKSNSKLVKFIKEYNI